MQAATRDKATFDYTIRPMTAEDIPALVEYFEEVEAREPFDQGTSLGEFTEWFHSPMNHSSYSVARLREEDGTEGKVIGVSEYERHPDQDFVFGWVEVHPDYRNAGIGSVLYNGLEERAREQKLASIRLGANQKATLLISFLERRGFELERYFWRMRLPAEAQTPEIEVPEGITIRTFVPNQDEELLTHVRNVTFADHYGSVNRTVEEMTHRTQEEYFRADGVFFAFDGSNNIVGFCYTGIDPRENQRRGIQVGHIHTLGVMPDYRGRGLGRLLLLVGVNYLREQVPVVELGVEGKNNTALRLYESVGFYQQNGWANMVKEL